MPINPIDLDNPGCSHVPSYWVATGGPEVEGCEALTGDLTADVAIVGAGYTGLSAAYHLARDFGVKAHILEANRVGWGCSGRNGGFCSPGIGKEDLQNWIERWGVSEARKIYEQSQDAVHLTRTILEAESIDAEPSDNGGLEVAHKPSRMKALAKRQRLLRDSFGVSTDLLSAEEVRSRFTASRESFGALLHPDGFALHPMRYVRGLARAAQKYGAVIHTQSPVLSWGKDNRGHILSSSQGRLIARNVVIATNGYGGDRVHPWLAGRTLPVLSNILVSRPLSEEERHSAGLNSTLRMVTTRRLLDYYRLLPDGRLMFGSRGGIEDTVRDKAYRRQYMERRVKELFPGFNRTSFDFFWDGWVCLTRDRNPHIGIFQDGSGIFYALGYAGTGVALATYAGRLLARRLGGVSDVGMGPLLDQPLPRFPLPSLRRFYQRAAYAYYQLEDRWL